MTSKYSPLDVAVGEDSMRPHHLYVTLGTNDQLLFALLDDSSETDQALRYLCVSIKNGAYTVMVVDTENVGIEPGGVKRWMDFVATLPKDIVIVYCESQLSMILRYTEDYVKLYPNHIHVSLYQ